MTTPNWYMLNKDGMATLCTDKEDAEKEAADAQSVWPHMGPYRAVQLVDAADVEALRAGYAAARLEIESLKSKIAESEVEHADAPENLSCKSTQKRLATQWGFVPAGAQQPGAATWTPLPGTLPEPEKPVLLDIGKKYPIRAMWVQKFTLLVGMEDDSGFGEYDEATEGIPAIIPPDAFRKFVDAHAMLCFCLHQRGHNPPKEGQRHG